MTPQDIADYQSRQRAFRETPAGAAFIKFEIAHGNAWVADQNPNYSDAALTKKWDTSRDAREALVEEIARLQEIERDPMRAAAAEMLASLRGFIRIADAECWGERPGDHPMRETIRRNAHSAIAKAEGRALIDKTEG